ncbi:Uncharacterised protein [Escherichia coli]|nr:Uncharacterised protein [Escherichia coli]
MKWRWRRTIRNAALILAELEKLDALFADDAS